MCQMNRVHPATISSAAILALILSMAVLAFASPSQAAKRMTPSSQANTERPDWSLDLTVGGAADAEVHGSGSKVSAWGAMFKMSFRDFSLSYEHVSYSWSDPDKLPFGNGKDEPWNGLSVLTLGYSHGGSLGPRWRYFVGGGVGASFEKEIDSDAFGVRGFGGVTYIFSEKLVFSLGGGGVWHKVRSQVLPVVGVIYNQGAKQGFSAALGYPQTHLIYHFNPNWAIKSRVVEFDLDVFRLADDSKAQPGGFLERQDLMADLGLEWAPASNLVLYLGVRYYFMRELTLYDQDGNNERTFDVDNAWGGVFRASWHF